jgi:hypothetical protein
MREAERAATEEETHTQEMSNTPPGRPRRRRQRVVSEKRAEVPRLNLVRGYLKTISGR